MIQRVQSIWLLLATLTLICMMFLPLLTKNINHTVYSIYTNGVHARPEGPSASPAKAELAIIPVALNIAAALFSFVSIFLYRNRSLQKRVILTAILLMVALAVLCGIQASQLPGGMPGISAGISSFLLLLALVFCMLAIRGIRKDEQLLRSADRLR